MGVDLKMVPGTLIEYRGKKENGKPHTLKRLELELNLNDESIIEALSHGTHPLFKGLDLLEQGAADGGGPYDLTLRRKVSDVSVEIVAAADRKTRVCKIDSAKFSGKWKVHIGANAETIRSRIVLFGGVARDVLATVDDYTGCDVLVNLRTLQTDVEEEAAKGKGGKTVDKGTKKVQLDIEGDVEGDDPDETKAAAE